MLRLLFQTDIYSELYKEQIVEEWTVGATGPKWQEYREIVVSEKTFFQGNMRLYAVRVPQLLLVPDQINYLYRLYSGNKTALTIKELAPFVPHFCALFPDPHERFEHIENPSMNSLLFFAQQVPGSRLKDIAKSSGGYNMVQMVVQKLLTALPTIHRCWGFCGAIDKEGVYFDNFSGKITILNWDRGQLPVLHVPGFDDGITKWETKDRFLCVFKTYGKRIINGFNAANSLFAVDKEALLNCLLECRLISRGQAQKPEKDILRKQLLRYTQKSSN